MGAGSKRYKFDKREIQNIAHYKSKEIIECMKKKEPFPEIKYQQCKVDWQLELLYLPYAPKEPIASFAEKGGTIFTSKKTPLMIVCNLATEKESEAALQAQYTNRLRDPNDEILINPKNAHASQQIVAVPPSGSIKRDQKRVMWKSGDDLR